MSEEDRAARRRGVFEKELVVGEAVRAAGVLVVPISQLCVLAGAAGTGGERVQAGGGGASVVPRALLVLPEGAARPRLMALGEAQEAGAFWREFLEAFPDLWQRARAAFARAGRRGVEPPSE